MQETKLADADAPARRVPRRPATSSRTTAKAAGTASPSPAAAASTDVVTNFGEPLRPRKTAGRRRRRAARRGADDRGRLRRRPRRLRLRAERPGRRLAVLRGQARLVRPPRALARRGGGSRASRSCSAATSTSRPRTPTCGTRAPATAAPTSRRRSARRSRGSARWGLVDAYRLHHPEPGRYTWWDYRAGNFHKNFGMRIDHLLVTRAARRAHGVGGDRPRGAQGQAACPPTTRRW